MDENQRQEHLITIAAILAIGASLLIVMVL